jgi:DNA repair protein RadC
LPSDNDKQITLDLVFAGNIMQIKVLDHIIIGENRYFSFADAGLIEEYNSDFLSLKEGKRA